MSRALPVVIGSSHAEHGGLNGLPAEDERPGVALLFCAVPNGVVAVKPVEIDLLLLRLGLLKADHIGVAARQIFAKALFE
jgi:hypothetical protein